MGKRKQLSFWSLNGNISGRLSDCPVTDYLEDGDSACYFFGGKHQCLHCNHPDLAAHLADVKGLDFENVDAKSVSLPQLPEFVPSVSSGSRYIFDKFSPPFVAVTLDKVINSKTLEVTDNIHRKIGLPEESKVLLLGYCNDELLEKIWNKRHQVLPKIASLDFDVMTALDYSVFLNQPHIHSLWNIKRSLITYEMLQKINIATIPHIYWLGNKDLCRWINWLRKRVCVKTVAICLSLIENDLWEDTISDLDFFRKTINPDTHFIITGVASRARITDIVKTLPNVSITNGVCYAKSVSKEKIVDGRTIQVLVPPFRENFNYYVGLIKNKKARNQSKQSSQGVFWSHYLSQMELPISNDLAFGGESIGKQKA